jgi:hypothetical protein
MSMRNLLVLLAIGFLALPGCQCCRLTEHYADHIDCFADHCDFKRKLDGIYCEDLDVSRLCMNRRCPPSCCPQARKPLYR